MSKVTTYIRDSYRELMHKTTWPTWNELQQSTMIVLIATIIITAIVWVMDTISQTVMEFIYSLFK
ncbi:MAG TPA: preprotein translocase subunit SecE [Ginsengibacter sp.]|nr:preprotein translocase subunit SecE [Chitinophagaceae bacterium]MCO5285282.1 preprotein translocase subunit SecE [Chitinophagaceae bacterium]MCW5913265.1 preprotein translocase subunit SecE [Chitinophagaceae bacterium]MCZ2397057.1 preprotein translocase subunit SecE [Chitinophagales bacterium]HRP43809.1 preprotein translocase subunit SecE [Ginsengibacter sp.]